MNKLHGIGFVMLVLAGKLAAGEPARPDAFAIRDGDVAVFLGDSITAAGTYVKLVENYTLLRFPDREVRFINAGFGGDTAEGGLKRLERDVLARGATLVVVAYGMNDIGWGVWADAEHKQKYLDAVRGIVGACRKRKVRVYLCSAPITGADPDKSEEGFLQTMCDEGMALARSLGERSIDVQREMRGIQKRVWAVNKAAKEESHKVSMHAADGAHLNELGHVAMAFAIVKGLGAPAEVSSVTLDAGQGRVVQAAGCTVRDIKTTRQQVEFTRLDAGLPLNYGLFFALHFRFVPFPDELNRYLLAVKNLPEGRYDVLADDRGVGSFTAGQLAAGVNIAFTTTDAWQPGGPWDAQAGVLRQLTEARHQLASARLLSGLYFPGQAERPPMGRQAEAVNSQIEELQRSIARPRPYRFVIRPIR
ncbi:MAG TPA: SGNH/GDSL hydrolase family protein, partial [Phycisphaerae bacterium]|nr:SGNH/GDSL hydrolase family protein [Phycisphaerae bacterium]